MGSSDLVFGGVILFLVVALFFITFFSGYLRRWARPTLTPIAIPLNDPIGSPFITGSHPHGLDLTVIDSFPTFDYSSIKSFKVIGNATLDCYVCLNEFQDDETLRLIPTCDHVFHVDCIDTWLAFNSTCPICRANLVHAQESTLVGEVEEQSQSGNEDVATSTQDEPVEGPHSAAAGPPRAKLSRNLTWWNNTTSGKSRWSTLGRLARSNSTGRLGVMKQREMAMERFTLRLPEEVRRKIITGKLRRARTTKEGVSGRRERGGSCGEERRWGRWLSTGGRWVSNSIPQRLVFRSKSMDLAMTVTPVSDCAMTSLV